MTKALTYLLVIYVAVSTPIFIHQIKTVQSHQNDALQSVMCFAQKRTAESKQTPAAQRRASVRFFAQALKAAHLVPCPPVP